MVLAGADRFSTLAKSCSEALSVHVYCIEAAGVGGERKTDLKQKRIFLLVCCR